MVEVTTMGSSCQRCNGQATWRTEETTMIMSRAGKGELATHGGSPNDRICRPKTGQRRREDEKVLDSGRAGRQTERRTGGQAVNCQRLV